MSITWTDEDILALPALDGCSGSSNPYYLTYDLAMKNGNMLSDLSDSAYDSNAISTVLVSNHSGTKAMGIDFLILPYTTIRLGVIYENQNQDCSSTIAVSSNFLLSSMPWDSENTSAPTPSN